MFNPPTLCGWDLAQFSSRAKTPSLHSIIQCSSMGKDSILVAAMAMPNPISRTRPPAARKMQQFDGHLLCYNSRKRSALCCLQVTGSSYYNLTKWCCLFSVQTVWSKYPRQGSHEIFIPTNVHTNSHSSICTFQLNVQNKLWRALLRTHNVEVRVCLCASSSSSVYFHTAVLAAAPCKPVGRFPWVVEQLL